MTNLADETLVEKALTGDDTAFGLLVLRHQQDIYQLALHYAKNPADAQDLTQEVFIKAYTRLSTLQETAKFANWLWHHQKPEHFMVAPTDAQFLV